MYLATVWKYSCTICRNFVEKNDITSTLIILLFWVNDLHFKKIETNETLIDWSDLPLFKLVLINFSKRLKRLSDLKKNVLIKNDRQLLFVIN